MTPRAIIFANGEMASWPNQLNLDANNDLVIAADGGAHLCQKWGIRPHTVIGDLDSISPELLARLETEKVEILRHPVNKDETDLELALRLAHQRGINEIIVLGALGQRWDMTLANVMLLAARFLLNTTVRLLDGRDTLLLLQEGRAVAIDGKVGDGLSLIPLTTTKGVTIKGLRFPLNDATLVVGTTQGVSNLFTLPKPIVVIRSGRLLIIHTRK